MSPIWWTFTLFGLGFLLLCIDVVVPSGGALAALSMVAFASSIGLAFTESASVGVTALLSEVVFLSLLVGLLVKWWPHSPLGRRILIQRSRVETETVAEPPSLKDLIGEVGIAKSKMLPAGSVVLHGKRYDAISKGSPVEAGQAVEVVSVDMNRIVVRATDRTVSPAPGQPDPANDLLSRPIEELGIESLEDPLG